MFLHDCDRTADKAVIKCSLLDMAETAGVPLSKAKADKLADAFKRGKYDPLLASLLIYPDPTGDRACRNVMAGAA
ncbi:hypothetical protein Bra3105_06475 [Brachybacterium halotolerans subsp. kimchii]|uniref:hypothetical protein n=1 Tax=Brachybacterium halotolerans TaxID=2795215 RepID=UPI001E2D997E|nr:hypothetical protein [Brachybacterium halotolerans]UEJ83951.1 hypothetical protein Bra3105_06475 [Brachybacterium halotolerans subsp. kimchii]